MRCTLTFRRVRAACLSAPRAWVVHERGMRGGGGDVWGNKGVSHSGPRSQRIITLNDEAATPPPTPPPCSGDSSCLDKNWDSKAHIWISAGQTAQMLPPRSPTPPPHADLTEHTGQHRSWEGSALSQHTNPCQAAFSLLGPTMLKSLLLPLSLFFCFFVQTTTNHNRLVSPTVWSFLYPFFIHTPLTLIICGAGAMLYDGQNTHTHKKHSNNICVTLYVFFFKLQLALMLNECFAGLCDNSFVKIMRKSILYCIALHE